MGTSCVLAHRMLKLYKLAASNEGCTEKAGNCVVKFPRFKEKMNNYKTKEYKLTRVINYIVYWQKTPDENEIKLIRPELMFEKQSAPTL